MRRTRKSPRDGAIRGFTLTELMIVVSIMGLLMAVVTPPVMRWTNSWRLDGETSKMATILRGARSTAVNKNINVIFVFDQSNGQYYTVDDTNGDGAASAGEWVSAVHSLPPGFEISAFTMPQQWITFGPKGNTADGGTITLAGKDNFKKTIRVFSGTGNVSIGS